MSDTIATMRAAAEDRILPNVNVTEEEASLFDHAPNFFNRLDFSSLVKTRDKAQGTAG